MRIEGTKNWTANELYDACVMSRQFKNYKNSYPIIARAYGRTPKGVERILSKVRQGKHSYQINPDKLDYRFIQFMNKKAAKRYADKGLKVMEFDFPKERKILEAPVLPISKPVFSLSLCWGLIKITKQK